MLAHSQFNSLLIYCMLNINNLSRLSQANSLSSLESKHYWKGKCRKNCTINTRSLTHLFRGKCYSACLIFAWLYAKAFSYSWFVHSYFLCNQITLKASHRLAGLVQLWAYSFLHFLISHSFHFLYSFSVPTFRPTQLCHTLTSTVLTLYCTHFSPCLYTMQMMTVLKGKEVTWLILMQVS